MLPAHRQYVGNEMVVTASEGEQVPSPSPPRSSILSVFTSSASSPFLLLGFGDDGAAAGAGAGGGGVGGPPRAQVRGARSAGVPLHPQRLHLFQWKGTPLRFEEPHAASLALARTACPRADERARVGAAELE
eukprot:1650903-Rhodomonas_salina.1